MNHDLVHLPGFDPLKGIASAATKFGDLIFTTQIPRNPTGDVGVGDFVEQSEQVLANLDQVLKALGSDLGRVLHLTVYLADIVDLPAFNDVYRARVPRPFPSRCGVEVARFGNDLMRIELTAIAASSNRVDEPISQP